MPSNRLLLALSALFTLIACGGSSEEPCPIGEFRIGAVCVTVMPDAGTDISISISEVCNGLDDDMDGVTDEADPMLGEACGADMGVCTMGMTVCTEGELVCDGVQPGEETCNGVDDDCDGESDEDLLQAFFLDEDGDGYGSGDACSACAPEECGEGVWVTMDGDCDESCDTCHEGAAEVCDGFDNDCDTFVDNGVQTLLFEDVDGDGYGDGLGTPGCLDEEGEAPEGLTAEDGDCGPEDARAFPGASASHSSPMTGPVRDDLRFDYDCDGTEAVGYPECGTMDGNSVALCELVLGESFCFVSDDDPICGVRGFHGPTRGFRDLEAGVNGCEFSGDFVIREFECR